MFLGVNLATLGDRSGGRLIRESLQGAGAWYARRPCNQREFV